MKNVCNIKHLIIISIIFLFAAGISPGIIFAADAGGAEYIRAEQLNRLSLIRGVGPGNYDMQRAPTRAESIIMVVRLIGKESEALRYSPNDNPFNDVPDWAARYVAYAYKNGLTRGISDSSFGSNLPIDSAQYMSFLLRALNYSDGMDFTHENSGAFASVVGLSAGWTDTGKFSRADMIVLSFNALNLNLNGSDETLAEHLVKAGVFTPAQWNAAAVLNNLMLIPQKNYEWENVNGVYAASPVQSISALKSAMASMPDEIIVFVPPGTEKEFIDYISAHCSNLIGFAREFDLRYVNNSGVLSIMPKYSKGFMSMTYLQNPTVPVSNDIKELALKGFEIYLDNFTDINSEYEFVKAVHDYVVFSLDYDINHRPGSEDLDGALNTGRATCGGYSAMFGFFAGIGGLQWEMVFGTARNAAGVIENHAWNKVRVNGEWYNVDVTWNDPIGATGTNSIIYKYFLISDSELAGSHVWDRRFYQSSPKSLDMKL